MRKVFEWPSSYQDCYNLNERVVMYLYEVSLASKHRYFMYVARFQQLYDIFGVCCDDGEIFNPLYYDKMDHVMYIGGIRQYDAGIW